MISMKPAQMIELDLADDVYWKLVELAAQLQMPVEDYCVNVLISCAEEAKEDD